MLEINKPNASKNKASQFIAFIKQTDQPALFTKNICQSALFTKNICHSAFFTKNIRHSASFVKNAVDQTFSDLFVKNTFNQPV